MHCSRARSDLKRAGSGKRVGVFECDELYTVRVLPKLKPTYFVLLNLFRDQLDRYGEIDHTQDVIAHALELSPATTLIYNADDPLCASIAARVPNMQASPLASTAPRAPSPIALVTRVFARSATRRWSTTMCSTASSEPIIVLRAAGVRPCACSVA